MHVARPTMHQSRLGRHHGPSTHAPCPQRIDQPFHRCDQVGAPLHSSKMLRRVPVPSFAEWAGCIALEQNPRLWRCVCRLRRDVRPEQSSGDVMLQPVSMKITLNRSAIGQSSRPPIHFDMCPCCPISLGVRGRPVNGALNAGRRGDNFRDAATKAPRCSSHIMGRHRGGTHGRTTAIPQTTGRLAPPPIRR